MMARRGVMGLIAGGATALLSGCGLFGGNSYRFQMTVEMESPQGLKSGASVYEVKAFGSHDLITGGKGSRTKLQGEAVTVELAPGKFLFALLQTVNKFHQDLATMSMRAMDPAFNYDWLESTKRIAARDGIRSPAEVAPADYPFLVTFGDINDPASVKRVDPENLGASLGDGVKLKRVTVEVVNDEVTFGIEENFRWWSEYRSRFLDGSSTASEDLTSTRIASHLSSASFTTEYLK